LVIAVGQLRPQKNYAMAIGAIAEVAARFQDLNIHYVICGAGLEQPFLSALASAIHIQGRVHFLGARTDVSSLVNAADLFLSTSAHEGLPLAVLEAMATNTPLLLSPISEHRDIAECVPGCHFYCDKGPANLAETLAVLLSARPEDNLFQSRTHVVQAYSIDRCALRYAELYEAALRGRNPTMHAGIDRA
jgi:glycosyltransferase involved in cell wall biosynthesis